MGRHTYEFIDGYAIYCERDWFKEGWDRWSEERYNILNEEHVKQFDKDYDNIKMLSSKSKKYYRIQNSRKVGLLSSKLQEILPEEYYHIELNKDSDIFIAVKERNEQDGYIVEYVKDDGEIIRSITCSDYVLAHSIYLNDRRINSDLFPPFTDKYCIVSNNSNKGILNINGNYIVPPVYEKLEIIDGNKVIACSNSKYGIINFNESIILDFQFDRMDYYGDNIFIVRKDNLEGVLNLLNPNNLKLKELKYDKCSEGTVIVSNGFEHKQEKFGVEDFEGNNLIPIVYDYLSQYKNGVAIVANGKNKGIISKNNNLIQSIIFDSITRCDNGFFITKSSNKYGLLKADGSILLKPIYSKIKSLKSCFRVENKGIYNYMDFNGKFEKDEWEQEEYGETYTQKEIDDMYRDAFDGFADAVWNVD